MKIKTSELSGAALEWAVAVCEGAKGLRLHTYRGINPGPPVWVVDWEFDWVELSGLEYSSDWALGGPIIEREKISVQELEGVWSAFFRDKLFEEDNSECWRDGPTPLIAAMRCYVASKMGDEVELPDDLI